MPLARRAGPALDRPARPRSARRRPSAPVLLHSAPVVLPVGAAPLHDGAVVVRGDRVLQVGARAELLAYFPVETEHRWPGTIVAGAVDACAAGAPPPGVTARAAVVRDPHEPAGLPGIAYVEVRSAAEEEWEARERDAVITMIREADRQGGCGLAARTRDPQVLEDVAVLARTFGLRLLADLDTHAPHALDEAGVLGPLCHAICSRPLDPGERKLLRLRRTAVAVGPAHPAADVLALLDEGNVVAFGCLGLPGGPLALAADVRRRARELGLRPRALDRRLVAAATLGGARALGMDQGAGRIGTLGPGARADFAVHDARGRYPYAALLAGAPCTGAVLGGAIISGTPE